MSQIVYTASPESQQIQVWKLIESGKLDLIQTVEVGGEVQPLLINSKHQRLYAGVRPDFRIISYQIDDEGKLTQLHQTPITASATHLSLDNHYRTLFIAHYHEGQISVCSLDNQGIPAEHTQLIEGLAGCHSTNVDLSGGLLYAPALKQDRVAVFAIDAEGQLNTQPSQVITTAKGAGPRHMAFHPAGHYAYVLNELDSTLLVIELNEQGGEIIQTLDIMPEDFAGTRWAADIHLTPDGNHLYACDRTSSLITHFALSQSGAQVKRLGHYSTEQQPRGFNIDLTGNYLIATGQKSDHIALVAIAPENGALSVVERYSAGKGAMWVVVHQRG